MLARTDKQECLTYRVLGRVSFLLAQMVKQNV